MGLMGVYKIRIKGEKTIRGICMGRSNIGANWGCVIMPEGNMSEIGYAK